MANYTFETMSQSDASAFTSADYLFFLSGSVANLGVSDTPQSVTSNGLGSTTVFESITLTEGGKSLTFGADALATASQSSPDHVVFGNNEVAIFGTAATADTFTVVGTAGHAAVAFGFGGADHITGGAGNDTLNGGEGDDIIVGSSSGTDSHGHLIENDFLLGGNGADTITGGVGNDHIYGNVAVGAAGTADGADSLDGGNGNDYINGNAGNDVIHGGNGNDRLYGGANNDTIDGGNGNDYIQGNKGNDNLFDNNGGNDTIHGGADNDWIHVTTGNNSLWGDNGNDSIYSGNGHDTVVGGAGYDYMQASTDAAHHTTFVFAAGDSSVANLTTNVTAGSHDLTDWIAGFTHGNDHLSLGFTVTGIETASGGTATNFANVDDAYTYAKAILAGHGTEVAALEVGTDTYLFWDSSHSTGTVDSVLGLGHYDAATVVKADFV